VVFHTDQKNVCGPQIAKFRYEQGLSQSDLATKCQLLEWDVSRDIIARIEGRVRWVGDFELATLAKALGVQITALFPEDFFD
jgi:transcriptional regulator with XRE-family HTH domain